MEKKIKYITFDKNQTVENLCSKKQRFNYPYYLDRLLVNRENENENENVTVFFRARFIDVVLSLFKSGKTVFIPFEPPVVDFTHSPYCLKKISCLFSYVVTWQDDLVDESKIFKFYFPYYDFLTFYDEVPFKQKKFITTIVGYKKSLIGDELYSEREKIIDYFENKNINFEFFGTGWSKERYSSYKGMVDSKIDTLRNYKFTICFENQKNINGLVSEKIFDCFLAKSIPIFWGAENVSTIFPEGTYIDMRDFSNYEDLYLYMENMTEEDYCNRVKIIRSFLETEEFKRHSVFAFCENIVQILNKKKASDTFFSKAKAIFILALFTTFNFSFRVLKKII